MLFIYDLDGTLFNTRNGNRKFYESVLGRAMSEDEAQYCFTHSMPSSVRFLFGEDADAVLQEIARRGVGEMVDGAVPEKNAIETVRKLKGDGHRVALNSNRTTAVKCLLDRWGMADCFDMVVTSLEVENPKPDPEGAYKIMSVLGRDAVYVGDSDIDRRTALASGCRFIEYGKDIKDHGEIFRYAL